MSKTNKIEYPPFSTWKWRSYDGKKEVSIDSFLNAYPSAEYYIGTDSQNYRKRKQLCVFTTVLIAYTRGRGGTILVHTDKTPVVDALRQRLLLEAMRSLETAWYVDTKIPEKTSVSIHLDVNENLKYKSAQYKDELVGLVIAQGYKCSWKPNSWASTSVADSKT